ncbi:hypothetical protein BC941DRAFT_446312 [Chlamydoabsidia padenii]|nr:hypothetical protein BC941DRAFT_446312 [Chlamydoabsidia padenii]
MSTSITAAVNLTRRSTRIKGPSIKQEQSLEQLPIVSKKDSISKQTKKIIKKESPATKKTPKIKKTSTPKKTPARKKASAPKKTSPLKKTPTEIVQSLLTEEEAALSPNMRARIGRAKREKLFVISRTSVSDHEEEFKVSGSTGNMYNVVIGPNVRCSCRDFIYRRAHCKHVLMILLKMFHLQPSSPIFATLHPAQNVLKDIFSTCIPDPAALVPEELKNLIDKKLHGEPVQVKTQRRPLDSSDCPVCCDEFNEAAIANILFCLVCGNNIHKQCFDMWQKTRGSNVTCVYCRSPWEDPLAPKKPKNLPRNYEGYVNFGSELGLTGTRDTSTYGVY